MQALFLIASPAFTDIGTRRAPRSLFEFGMQSLIPVSWTGAEI